MRHSIADILIVGAVETFDDALDPRRPVHGHRRLSPAMLPQKQWLIGTSVDHQVLA